MKNINGKISIGTLLAVILILVIIIMGACIYLYYYNNSNSTVLPSENLNENISQNIISNDISNETENNISNSTSSTEYKPVNSIERECKKVLEKYMEIVTISYASPDSIGVVLELSEESDVSNYTYSNEDFCTTTDIKFEDFKNEMLKYMSEDLFDKISNPERLKEYGPLYKNVNGLLVIFSTGASGRTYVINNMKQYSPSSEESDSLSYYIETTATTGEWSEPENFVAKFEASSNGNYIISEIIYNTVNLNTAIN